jgi:protein TonB
MSLACTLLLGISMMLANPTGAFLPGGEEKETAYLPFADVMPEPVGGLGAISKRLVYPEMAKNAQIQGKIYLIAYINEKGDVDDVKIIKGLPAGCDDAAIKAIKETKFVPGKQNGTPVKVQLSIPVSFKLQ